MIDELLVGLGFKYDKKDLKSFKDDISKTTDLLKTFGKVALAASAAIGSIITASTKATDTQGKLANEIGESVEVISALQHALEISGGSADGMSNSLRTLSIRAAEAARGVGGGVEAFGVLGISVLNANGTIKKSSDLMLEVSRRFSNLEKSKQIDLADKLGIGDSIRLLQAGPDAIRALTEEAIALGVATDEDAKIAAEFQDSLLKVWRVMKDMGRLITRELAPGIIRMKDQFTDWWKINRDIISQNLPIWIDRITTAMKLLIIATGAWLGMRLVTHIASLIAMFKGLSIAALAANAAALLLPILIGVALTSLGLLIEDAKTFFEGGESFIGDMLKRFPEWSSELTVIAAIFGTIYDLTSKIFEGWTNIFNIFRSSTLEDIKDLFKNIPRIAVDVAGNTLSGGADIISNLKRDVEESSAGRAISGVVGSVKETFLTTVDSIEIIVNGGIDSAEAIGKAVANELQQTYQNLSTTVDQ